MATRVRPKLTTAQAEAVGAKAAQEYERQRQAEAAQAEKEAVRERQKQEFLQPLIEAGLSKQQAEAAWVEHVVEITTQQTARVREQSRRNIARRL